MAGPLPPSWDEELSELFADQPEMLETAGRLRASRPRPELGAHFRPYLRARLMDAAASELRPRGLRRLLPRPVILAWSGAGLGAAMIVAVAATTVLYHPDDAITGHPVLASSAVAGNPRVDPDNSIRIDFNQPMNERAVVAGLHVQPATAYTTVWQANTLVITPQHKLAANTPYTVTIARDAARTSAGALASTDIAITFGTKPTTGVGEPPAPPGPPQLAFRSVGPVDASARLTVGLDGTLLATSGPAPSTSAPASPVASPAPGRTAAPSSSPSAPGSASPGPTASGLVRLGSDGTVVRLGDPATTATLSPDGRSVAFTAAGSGGRAAIRLAGADGSNPVTLATTDDAATPLAWRGGDRPLIVFVSDGLLKSVDLSGRVRTLSTHPVDHPAGVVLSADGRHAYLAPAASTASVQSSASPAPATSASASPAPAPSGSPAGPTSTPTSSGPRATAVAPTAEDGTVIDLVSGATHRLGGPAPVVAFSQDGSHLGWVSAANGQAHLLVEPTAALGDPTAATSVPVPDAASPQITDLVLDGDGGRAVYVLNRPNADAELRVVELPSGNVLASLAGAGRNPVIDAGGGVVAVVGSDGGRAVAREASVPRTQTVPSAPVVPAEASAALSRLIDLQTAPRPDPEALAAIAQPSAVDDLRAAAARGVSRGYLISSALITGSPSTISAHIRLIRDPAASDAKVAPALFSDEDVVLTRRGGGAAPYLVASLRSTPLAAQPTGPQVVHLGSTVQGGTTVVRVSFDSDLLPDTVGGAVTVLDDAGRTLTSSTVYDADQRTLAVSVNAAHPALLRVATSLRDVDGRPLAALFESPVPAS